MQELDFPIPVCTQHSVEAYHGCWFCMWHPQDHIQEAIKTRHHLRVLKKKFLQLYCPPKQLSYSYKDTSVSFSMTGHGQV